MRDGGKRRHYGISGQTVEETMVENSYLDRDSPWGHTIRSDTRIDWLVTTRRHREMR